MAGQQQVCKFFRQGNCRFGNRCNFLHPSNLAPESQRNSQPGNRNNSSSNNNNNNSSNRYGPLSGFGAGGRSSHNSNQNNSRNHNENGNAFAGRVQDGRNSRNNNHNNNNSNSNSRSSTATNKFGVSAQMIEDELTKERPEWILSCYGPGKDAPVQLFGGEPMETSPEELRYQTYLAAAQNMPPEECAARENALYQAAQNQIMQVLNDIPGALHYIESGSKHHPNRLDAIHSVRVPRGAYFAKSNYRARNPRSQQNQNPAASNQAPAPTFFQSPQVANQSSPFDTSSRPSQSFAQQVQTQDAPMDTPMQPVSAFGSAMPGSGGQPSFGMSGFGVPHQASTFGSNQIAQPPHNSVSALAGPSLAFATVHPTNTFGQPSTVQPTSSFGQPSNIQPTASFGQPSALDQASNYNTNSASVGFGNPALAQAPPAGFQQMQTVPMKPQNVQPDSAMPEQIRPHTEMRDMSGKLSSWNGRAVRYEGNNAFNQTSDGKGWERIWIPEPNGAQVTLQKALNSLADLPPVDEYPVEVRSTYEQVLQSGVFPSVIPELPPRPEWTSYHV